MEQKTVERKAYARRSLKAGYWAIPGLPVFFKLVQHRALLKELARRDLSDRYAGQILGTFWAVLHPTAIIGVFVFFFGFVFPSKIAAGLSFPVDHTVYLVAGLLPWMITAEVLARASTAISSSSVLVKQVIFPVEILPVKMVLATLPTMIIGLTGLLLYTVLRFGTVSWAWLMLIPATLLLYIFLTGLALAVSAVGVYLRDLKDLVQLYTLVGLYLAPILYAIDIMPRPVQVLISLNPVTPFVLCFQEAAYHQMDGGPTAWITSALLAMVALIGGASLFNRLQRHFGTFL